MSQDRKAEDQPFLIDGEPTAEFVPEAGNDFVVTPYIQDLTDRAIAYLTIGYALHLSGPAGTGKSTLAMHIASQLGKPCTLLHGDDEFKASDLLGRDTGYQRRSMVDNYVSSIVKTEETLSVVWSSNRLTTACQKGHTLIYDEFTRSPATANNPFLSILEEGILNIPSSGKQKGYIKVHPDFRAIFTSNPEEYVGVHKTQDALLDRMITMRLDYQDQDTEAAIVCAKSGRPLEDSETIVRIVRALRKLMGGMNGPTVRSAIAIARILNFRNAAVDPDDPIFITTCKDVLYFHLTRQGSDRVVEKEAEQIIRNLGHAEEPGNDMIDVSVATHTAEPDTNSEQPPQFAADAKEIVDDQASTMTDHSERVIPPQVELPNTSSEPEVELLENALDLEQSITNQVRANDHDRSPSPHKHVTHAPPGNALPRPPVNDVVATADELHQSNPGDTAEMPRPQLASSETASPQQMLEAAMARFRRPPTLGVAATPSPELLS